MNPEYEIYWRAAGAVVGGLDVLFAQLMIVPRSCGDLKGDVTTIGEIKDDYRRVDWRGYGRAVGCVTRVGTVLAGATIGAMYPRVAIGVPGVLVGLKVMHEWPSIQRRLRGLLRG